MPGATPPWPLHWQPADGSLSSSMPFRRSTTPFSHPCRRTHPTTSTLHSPGCGRQHLMRKCTCLGPTWRTRPSQWMNITQLSDQQWAFPMEAWSKDLAAWERSPAAWETGPVHRSEAMCISRPRWPSCSMEGLSQLLRHLTREDTIGERP